MSKGVNRVILIGNLGRDPEIRQTNSGASVANFSIATSESWNDKATGERKDVTEWHRIVAFGRLAEICGEYLRKGSKVYIEGALRTRQYEKDGQTHHSTEIIAREMQMLGGRGESGASGSADDDAPAPMADRSKVKAVAKAASGADDFSDDIPF